MNRRGFRFWALIVGLGAFLSGPAWARNAAFINPGSVGIGGPNDEAVKVEPKSEIDIGETPVNVTKRTTIFFVNKTNEPVKIEKVTYGSDTIITAEEVSNDCTKQGEIAPASRCTVEVSVTPTGIGSWNVDVLMTHAGAGRIARAKLSGKTSSVGSSDPKSTGLSISSKEVKPVDFGVVNIGSGKIVRSAVMVNDSPDAITLQSIDVIEANNGLQKLEQGCAVNTELAPGASCPVTLVWEPTDTSPISTDLIIRHTGKLGFSVIPVRGLVKAEGGGGSGGVSGNDYSSSGKSGGKSKNFVPLPPSAHDLEKAVEGKIEPVSGAALGAGGSPSLTPKAMSSDGKLNLIGTSGSRAILLLPNGETALAQTGERVNTKGYGSVKVVAVRANSVDLIVDGKKKTLQLEASPWLVSTALEQAKQNGQGGSSSQKNTANDGNNK